MRRVRTAHGTERSGRQSAGRQRTPQQQSRPSRRQVLQQQAGNQAVAQAASQHQAAAPATQAEGAVSQLSDAEVAAAIQYNESRFQSWGISIIQDIVGASPTGSMNENTVHMIAQFQADHGLDVDGKVGRYSLEPICERLINEGQQNPAIHLIIDGHDMPTGALDNGRWDVSYDPSESAFGSTTRDASGHIAVHIGPSAIRNYEELVHTIRHELKHTQQLDSGMSGAKIAGVGEFQAEATEILSQGMQLESLDGLMMDAHRAMYRWLRMSDDEKRANKDTFFELRDEIERRLQPLSPRQLRRRTVPSGDTYLNILNHYLHATIP